MVSVVSVVPGSVVSVVPGSVSVVPGSVVGSSVVGASVVGASVVPAVDSSVVLGSVSQATRATVRTMQSANKTSNFFMITFPFMYFCFL